MLMEIDINSIVAAIGGVIGTGSLAVVIGTFVPLIAKKKTLGKLARRIVRFVLRGATIQSMSGEGWKATVFYVVACATDEADKKLVEIGSEENK
jgi:hypothetical protein